jgi:glycosyltransferase involved in cell wall biosynthesis
VRRVLFCEGGRHGGSVKKLITLIGGLDARRVEAAVLSAFRTGTAERLLGLSGAFPRITLGLVEDPAPDVLWRVGPLPSPSRFGLRYLRTALHALRDYRPDLVYFNNPLYCHLPMVLACRLRGVPYVCHQRDTVRLTIAERWALNGAAAVIALSQAAKTLYAAQGLDPLKIRVVYNGISVEEFDRAARAQAALAPADGLVVALAGSFVPRKRQKEAIEALARLSPEFPDARLELIGDGPDRAELTALASARGLGDRVRVSGWAQEVAPHLASAAVGLMLSDREGMPNVVLEYMAASLPVVVTDLPGIREMVHDGETGFLVGVGDADALEDRLRRLLRDPGLRRKMGACGRSFLESGHFTETEEHRGLTELIESVF